ncbi:short-chain dehydrogenase [Terrihalobacillus insolitus]|uniref:short-chain dehydrogenase n=1 Tax=Terrihalobacillus insolitus TaxID=2950438 RepID=UPI0023416F65|nr:short-chain dehydrogenase [Terrihalobacillus insolitus]MDC3415208.1 short-chain dehydrogenase [Terrihalobacillus insolitus]
MNPKHALVIGGTGMLKDVSLWLTNEGFIVSIIGRSKSKHLDLVNKASHPELINSLMVDYNNHSLLEEGIRDAIGKHGPIALVVSWTPSLPSLEIANNIISEQSRKWKFFQIKGSRRYFNDDSLNISSSCEHRSIYLGFVIENNHSRWLTNREIAQGVIKSVIDDSKQSIIGRLHPYEKRPKY